MGFSEVYEYKPSKADWLARGLPTEGARAGELRALDFATADVITCQLGDQVGTVRDSSAESAFKFALVVSADGIVLGRLRRAALEGPGDALAQDVMEPGPSTSRPDMAPEKLLKKLMDRELKTAILTDPEGRLLGIVRRAALEQAGQAA